MRRLLTLLATVLLAAIPVIARAAGAVEGGAQQATNWHAIFMFILFVCLTLGITYWAAKRTKSAAQFYSAGGGITGFQNGIAIAGDYMSAASFLGISGLVYLSGFDGLIYSVGFLVGWPIVTFLIAEPLRNLGKYTFADVASFRLGQTPIRILAACGSLVTVSFYLIAQMVGAGKLIQILFGLDYWMAVVIVGVLMIIYVTFGGMLATTWVQIIKAVLLLSGATFMALAVLWKFGFNPEALFAKAVEVHPKHLAIMAPGTLVSNPISAISLGLALIFGTAGLPHILMRFFTVADAKAARKSVFVATGFIGYFYILTFIIGFGAICLVSTNPQFLDAAIAATKGPIAAIKGGSNMAAIHLADAVGGDLFLGFISAVAFATILAVVSGLALAGASAISHDLYANVFRRGRVNETRGDAGVEDRHGPPWRARHLSRHRIRKAERRLHGGPRLLHCRLLQFPSSAAVDLLARAHHARRLHRRIPGPHLGGGDGRAFARGVGGHARQPEGIGAVPLRESGPVLDGDRLRRHLALLPAR